MGGQAMTDPGPADDLSRAGATARTAPEVRAAPAATPMVTARPVTPSRPVTAAQKEAALRRVNRKRGALVVFWEWAKTFQIAVLLFLLIHVFFAEAFKIPSGSMERTLLPGDFLIVNKLAYGPSVPFTSWRLPAIRPPRRGDVMVFQYPRDLSKSFVKRVVGVPGDTLAMRDGVLFHNGTLVREDYVSHTQPNADPSSSDFAWQRAHLVRTAEASRGIPSRNNWGPLIVPARSYFLLGDNRDNSSDSRYWGFLPDSLVRGRPLFVYWSYVPDASERLDFLTRVRWERLGERVH